LAVLSGLAGISVLAGVVLAETVLAKVIRMMPIPRIFLDFILVSHRKEMSLKRRPKTLFPWVNP
jgi:hypothetical protein